MAELLKILSEINGVSGNENGVRTIITDALKNKCDDVTTDTMGNIIAFKKGKKKGKTIAVTANMDEIGFIISEITDKGYLKFKAVGDIDPRKLVSKRVIVGGGVKGVIGMKAIHLQTVDERKKVVKVKDLFIDIGSESKEETEKRVKLGDYVTFDTAFEVLGDNVKGKALDRSGACFALINALDGDYPYDFYACFLAQHEVGSRGALIAAQRINPDVILTVAAGDTTDMYGCKDDIGMKMGEGVVLSYGDKTTLPDKCLTDITANLAAENDVKLQKKVIRPYFTDGGAMQLVDAKVVTAVIPCRYSHSPVSVMNLGDIDETTRLIRLFLSDEKCLVG